VLSCGSIVLSAKLYVAFSRIDKFVAVFDVVAELAAFDSATRPVRLVRIHLAALATNIHKLSRE